MIESFVNQVFMLGRSDVCNAGSISSLYVLLYSYTQATSGHEMCGLGTRLVHTLLIWFDWSKWIGYIPGQALSVFVHWYWKWCETSPGLGWVWPQGTTRTVTFFAAKDFCYKWTSIILQLAAVFFLSVSGSGMQISAHNYEEYRGTTIPLNLPLP